MVFLFSVLGAAVFAKPTVTKVEKVIGLIHKVGTCLCLVPSGVLEAPSTEIEIS
jgi:hypothetical protein